MKIKFKKTHFILCMSAFLIHLSLLGIQKSSEAMDLSDANEAYAPAAYVMPQTQEEINRIVIETAQDVYARINKNWNYPQTSQPMRTDSLFWEPKWIPGTMMAEGQKKAANIPTMVLKTSPQNLSEALDDLINKSTIAECTIALTTVKIFCLRNILGPEAFNLYATQFYDAIQNAGWSVEEFFHELPLQFIEQKDGPAQPGSICYLTNVPFYAFFKPGGNAFGSNVFCIDSDRYIGFSCIYERGPQALEVIESMDLDLFCREDDVQRNPEQHTIIATRFKQDKSSFITMRRKAQEKNCNFHNVFDLRTVHDFINTGQIIL